MAKAKKKDPIDFDDFIFSRVPPKALEFEETVLGAMMIESSAFSKVERYLKTENVFYDDKHKIIYRAIKECFEAYNECDDMLVTEQLKRMGLLAEVGGAGRIMELTVKVASTAHIVAHSLILHQKYIAREMIRLAAEVVNKAFDDSEDVFVTLDDAMKILDEVRVDLASMKNVDFKRQISNTMLSIQEASKNESIGIPTGMHNVDAITGGRVNGELTLIAARPSMGKTARMIQEAMNMALGQNRKVGIISMEMTHQQIITRMLSNISKINSQLIRAGRMTDAQWQNLVNSSGRLSDSNFYLNDVTNLTITDIRGIIRGWVDLEKVEIVYIDYIGLIKFQNLNGKPVDEISKISRGLKTIAGECNIPIVALSQLNREVEKRGDKRPVQSDLRDSGSLEQDADVLTFLYRPDYYGVLTDDNGESTKDLCEENISKNRNGALGRTWHRYVKEINEFTHHDNSPLMVKASTKELPQETSTDKEYVEGTPW